MELQKLINPLENPMSSYFTILAILTLLNHIRKHYLTKKLQLKNKVAFITGGSEGSGFECARYFIQQGGSVTIVSRSQEKLEKAKAELLKEIKNLDQMNKENRVFIYAADVSDLQQVQSAIEYSEKMHKDVPDYVIMAAGMARPGYFIEQNINQCKKLMEINYYGCLYTSKAIIPDLITQNKKSKLIFFSSAVAVCGLIGYSSYVPTKFALRGLADGLQSELKPYGIDVHIFLPSNIDSPGFKEENLTKPIETQEIEGQASLFSPKIVAQCLFEGIRRGEYTITNEFLIEMGRIMTDGPVPTNNIFLDMLIAPLMPLIRLFYSLFQAYVIKKHFKQTKRRILDKIK